MTEHAPAGAEVLEASRWVLNLCVGVRGEEWEECCLGEWTRRRVLDHLIDSMLLYAAAIATRATGRTTPVRNGDDRAEVTALARALEASSAIVSRLIDGMAPIDRAYHPSGVADASGWAGMACTELLVHGWDMAPGAALPEQLASRVVDRVLPWAPPGHPGPDRLLWATGRASLADRPPGPPDWWWQSAPLSEWDGRPRRRSSPPQW